jgi:outer membrane protein assembly factor BamE
MRKLLILLNVVTSLVILPGCAGNKQQDDEYRSSALSNLPFVYKMTVQQGNIITEDMIDQLELGMTKAQVRYILGTPLLMDMFHTDRWDYTYTIRRGHQPMSTERLTLWFQDDQLVRIDGNMQPNPQRALDAREERELVVDVPDWQDNRGLINRTLNTIGVKTAD